VPVVPTRNARSTIQAESYDDMLGVRKSASGTTVGYTEEGDWMKYAAVDFGAGVTKVNVRLALGPEAAGGQIEFRLGSPIGAVVGTLTTASTGGWGTYTTQTTAITGATGVQDLYVVFHGTGGVANVDWIVFA
jgi:hypothetical protein